MMRSMFAGVSGLKVHQTRMDVIGNNIANVNTVGYKASRATFQEMLSQTLQAATIDPSGARGGTNPMQVGRGVRLGSIDVRHTQGNTQSTGYVTDLAIDGDGFFVLGSGESRMYTRAGIFGLDGEGNLISLVNGLKVYGYMPNAQGEIDTSATMQPIRIASSATIDAKATNQVVFGGNLDARYEYGAQEVRIFQVYDSQGQQHTVRLTLKRSEDTPAPSNKWEWSAEWLIEGSRVRSDLVKGSGSQITHNVTYSVLSDEDESKLKLVVSGTTDPVATSTDGVVWETETDSSLQFQFAGALAPGDKVNVTLEQGQLVFTATRDLSSAGGSAGGSAEWMGNIEFSEDGSYRGVSHNVIKFRPANANELKIELDFSQFTQYADTFSGKVLSQNGYTSGSLDSFLIDQNGTIIGSFSNGLTKELGRLALATFRNPAGLLRTGSTMFVPTANSGEANPGAAGEPGFGQIAPSSLEMSNVDLAEEFTEMIITQRGFQANSRIITTSDEMLQELVNLKR